MVATGVPEAAFVASIIVRFPIKDLVKMLAREFWVSPFVKQASVKLLTALKWIPIVLRLFPNSAPLYQLLLL